LCYIITGLMLISTMKLHTSVEVEWDERAGVFNIQLWQCHRMPIDPSHPTNILVSYFLYLNVLCDYTYSPCRLAVEELITRKIDHDISVPNSTLSDPVTVSYPFIIFPILLWLFSFVSSRFLPFHYYPCPLPLSFLIFFTLISPLPSYSPSPPLYPIPLTFLYSFPCSLLRLLWPKASPPSTSG
jgi:hypothetical protein